MRWIVGDVQGCAAELEDLLDAVRFDPRRDELWAAGDLVNRGPRSLDALRLWHRVGGRGVLGNHDLYALLARSGRRRRKADSLDELFAAPDCDALLARLRRLPVLVHLPSPGRGPEAWLVHGGLHPAWHDLPAIAGRLGEGEHDDDWLEQPEVSYAVNLRCCLPDGTPDHGSGPTCKPPFAPWDAYYRGDVLVVHGHWATRGHYRGRRTLGLDSGCVYGGSLTAWCQDEDRIVQVPSRQPRAF
ncbi:MAG: hypothetical protein D6696_14670 [Acidobacteria bacterium]|nr:MAG: hypothetical protein D6696_14670 [Acidobacteriota bacterium]